MCDGGHSLPLWRGIIWGVVGWYVSVRRVSTKGEIKMLVDKPDEQLRSTLAIASSMCGLWFLGVIALTLVPTHAGSRDAKEHVTFRHQAAGATYAYQDVSGQFTVYLRGTQRITAP